MTMKILTGALTLTIAISAAAQSRGIDIRATGEHLSGPGDTPDSARQLALLDAERKALQTAVTHLQGVADVNALQLTPIQLEAYTAVMLEIDREAAGAGSPLPLRVRTVFDAEAAVRRMAGLRRDPDAAQSIVRIWAQVQQLQRQIADQTGRRAKLSGSEADAIVKEQLRAIADLEAKQLAARTAFQLARTELATVGGTAPTPEGLKRARAFAEAAVARAPDSPDARYALGDALVYAEDPAAAEPEYRKALSGDGGSVTGRLKLAEALRLQGKFDEAAAELREIIRIRPDFAQAHSDFGMVLRGQGDLPGSIAEYREAVRLDPRSTDAYNGLAIALANNKQMPDAVAAFREVVRIDPDSAIGYYNLAFALAEMDLDVESAAALREVIRINPNHYNARFNLGELFRLEGKYDDSARQFREFLRLAPNTPQNQRNIGRASRYVKQFED